MLLWSFCIQYSLVPFRRHNSINWHLVFHMDCAALHEFWARVTYLLEACSLIGIVSFLPILILEPCLLIGLCPTKKSFMSFHSNMTSWGVPINWNMSSNRNQRVDDYWTTVTTHFTSLLQIKLNLKWWSQQMKTKENRLHFSCRLLGHSKLFVLMSLFLRNGQNLCWLEIAISYPN